ncbi:MAG: zinc ribbon domain-containing protein [Thermoplasmata archaeon]|nr:zinc ribbon domain-containing protein [Thermoplasmata archaeon]
MTRVRVNHSGDLVAVVPRGVWSRLAPALLVGFVLLAGALLAPLLGPSHTPGPSPLAHGLTMFTSYPNNGISPPPTTGAGAAYDPADGYVLMFGGENDAQTPISYSWTFGHNNWTNLTSSVGGAPAARWAEGLAYDSTDGYVVLFGGCYDFACKDVSDSTWTYSHDRWTNISAKQNETPPAAGHVSMVYDAHDGYILLFGGFGSGASFLNEEWEFRGGQWSPIGAASSTVPTGRAGGMVAYDGASGSVILFGGAAQFQRLDDTWSYQSGNWTNLTGSAGAAPPPRWQAMLAFDSADGYLLLVNGYSGGTYYGDEWTFAGGTWSALHVNNGPPASLGAVFVYDAADGYVLYFSGMTPNGLLTSTFIYANGAWTLLLNPPGSPFPLLFVGLLLLFFALPVTVGVLVGARNRRRRERELGEGFVLPPGESIRWIPSGPALRAANVRRLGLLALMFVVFLPFLIVVITAGSGASAAVPVVGIEIGVVTLLIVGLVYGTSRQSTREIGVVRSGVIVRRGVGELRVGWPQLQPGVMVPSRGVFWFQTVPSGKSMPMGGFSTTLEQARAIVLSPYAPPWVLAPRFATGLGVPAQRSVGTPGVLLAPPTGPPPTPYAATLPPPTPYDPPASPAYPSYPPPPSSPPARYSPYPPTRPDPGPPLVSSAPAGPPPGMVMCPNCGQPNPVGRVAFCQSCGRRLPR